MDPTSEFRDPYYLRLNGRRLEHLASLRLPIEGAQVLEVGAGIGDHTSFFLDRGCRVTVTDGREENLAVARKRYAREPRVRTMALHFDDLPAPEAVGSHEVVYCYGLLYHLQDPAAALAFLASVAVAGAGLLLVETVVAFGDEDVVHESPSQPQRSWGSTTGTGCLPTRRWMANRLAERFPHVAMTKTQPWHEEFPVSWRGAPSRAVKGLGLGRAVWVAARWPVPCAGLGAPVEDEQTRDEAAAR